MLKYINNMLEFIINHFAFLKNIFIMILLGLLFNVDQSRLALIAEIIGGIVFILGDHGLAYLNRKAEDETVAETD